MKCQKCGCPTIFPVKTKDGLICPQCAIDKYVPGMFKDTMTPSGVTHPNDTLTNISIAYAPMPEVAKYLLPSGAISMPPFAALRPADPALEAIGRAFDDALDLAYLG